MIAGTGLTMIDLAMSVSAARPAAVVHAISRHGLLPRTHPGSFPSDRQLWLPVISRTTGPVRLGDLMWQVRSAMASSPAGWHSVMDSLRPYVPGLWRRMPEQDKRLFLRHVARYWEVHRHLMPPATATRITTLRATGQLALHRGHVVRVTAARSGGLRVLVNGGADTIELEAGWLINGTGATGNIRSAASPLLRDLFASGQARPDPLGLGLDATSGGAVLDAAGLAERRDLHARAAAARPVVRDHGHPGDPRAGGVTRPQDHQRQPADPASRQRGLTPDRAA